MQLISKVEELSQLALQIRQGNANQIPENKQLIEGNKIEADQLKEQVKKLRGELHIDFRTQCFIITLGSGGLSLMKFSDSENLSNFKVHELS